MLVDLSRQPYYLGGGDNLAVVGWVIRVFSRGILERTYGKILIFVSVVEQKMVTKWYYNRFIGLTSVAFHSIF